MSVLVHKHYLADKKPFLKHFYPRDVTITAIRSVTIQGLLVFNGFIASLDLEESDEEDTASEEELDELDQFKRRAQKAEKKDDWEPPTTEQFAAACLTSFTKSLSISTCVRTLEEIALRFCRPRIVGKLVKDVSKSATRKYVRTHSRLSAALLMVKTGMRANVLSHVAIFIVEEAHQLILILYRKYKSSKGAPKKGMKALEDDDKPHPTFLEITARNASRSGLAVFTGGLGAAVGTFIRPGLGTVVGATLGDTLAYVI